MSVQVLGPCSDIHLNPQQRNTGSGGFFLPSPWQGSRSKSGLLILVSMWRFREVTEPIVRPPVYQSGEMRNIF